MEYGYIKLSRKFFNSKIWQTARALSECEAWLDLIQSARFEASPTTSRIGSYEVTWGRGQYPASIRFLSKKWGRPERWVRTFLAALKREKMITCENTQGVSVITLINYDKYNGGDTLCDTPSDTLNGITDSELRQIVTHLLTHPSAQPLEMRHTIDTKTRKDKENNKEISSSSPSRTCVSERQNPDGSFSEQFLSEMSLDQSWTELMCMRFQLTPDTLLSLLHDFDVDCRCRGSSGHQSLQDSKQHFCSWLQIQQSHTRSCHKSSNLQQADDYARRTGLLHDAVVTVAATPTSPAILTIPTPPNK